MSNPTGLPDLDKLEAHVLATKNAGETTYVLPVSSMSALIALARRAQPEGEAPQAEHYEVWNYAHECWEPTDQNGYLASHETNRRITPAATLSPLCGAQHAESGEPVALAAQALLNCCDGLKANSTGWHAAMAEFDRTRESLRAALAAQQAAAPGALEIDRGALELANSALIASEPKFAEGWPRHERAVHLTSCALHKPAGAPSAPCTPEAPKGGV